MDDVTTLQNSLIEKYAIGPQHVIAYGRSLGSLCAAEYSVRYPNLGKTKNRNEQNPVPGFNFHFLYFQLELLLKVDFVMEHLF